MSNIVNVKGGDAAEISMHGKNRGNYIYIRK